MIVDRNKGITGIKYNHLNLPTEIVLSNGKINYFYTSSGEKVQKKVTQGTTITTTDYLGGFQYVNGELKFFPTAEGYFNAETNNYVYQYQDHLGNVRLSYSDANKNNKIDVGEIVEENNYYPFGLAHSGYNEKNNTIAEAYKYQYNGKELQDELGLNLYDYHARNYDAAIGRWMNVDPLAEKAPNWTPYRYGFNNPINFTDPTGMFESKSDAKSWAKENNISTGWFSRNKVNQSEDGSWSVKNKKDGFSYSRADSGKGFSTERADGVVESLLVSKEGQQQSSQHPYFNAVPSGEYGPYRPDASGLSINASAFGSAFGISLAWDEKNNFDTFFSFSGGGGFNSGGSKSYFPSLSATLDFYENNHPTMGVLSGIAGRSYDVNAGYVYTVGYSRPLGGEGAHKVSFGLGGGFRMGQSKTYSSSEMISNFKSYMKSIKP